MSNLRTESDVNNNSTMSNYTFSTINDKEFEELVRDLLNAKFNLGLESFKRGRDKGVDLRYSTPKKSNSIVVQAKHYIESNIKTLCDNLNRIELEKVKRLQPDRYIIVTSLPLSAKDKEEIKMIFYPFILNASDVIGRESLNEYLSNFKNIEIKYYNLWLSSVNVLNTIFNNAVEGRSKNVLEQISKKIHFLVLTQSNIQARKILKDKKILLITGQPGVGKTTLAEMMIFEYAKIGYKVFCVVDLFEAESMISIDNNEKQLFYYDDFLGTSYLESSNQSIIENQLVRFINRVIHTPNKYIVLTTRTVILNSANEQYEKLSRISTEHNQFELKIGDYTKYEKALILYKHFYFNGYKKELYNEINNNKFYNVIIDHLNFTPRIIEFITDNLEDNDLRGESLTNYIISNLNNPEQIWRKSFSNQITHFDRCLLLTLLTFEKDVNELDLQKSFESRMQYEKNNNHAIVAGQYFLSLRRLHKGFVKSNLHENGKKINFINPSLRDFLLSYINNSISEKMSIVDSIYFIEQLDILTQGNKIIPLDKEIQKAILCKLSNLDISSLKDTWTNSYVNGKIVKILESISKYCYEIDIDQVLKNNLMQLNFSESWHAISDSMLFFLMQVPDNTSAYLHVKSDFLNFIERIIDNIYEFDFAMKIPNLFIKYNFDYKKYSESDRGSELILTLINNVMTQLEEGVKHELRDAVSMDEVDDKFDELIDTRNTLDRHLLPTVYFFGLYDIYFDRSYWEEKTESNWAQEKKRIDTDYDRTFIHGSKDINSRFLSESQQIDNLFSKSE